MVTVADMAIKMLQLSNRRSKGPTALWRLLVDRNEIAYQGANGVLRLLTSSIVLIAVAHFALFGYFLVQTRISSPISDMFAYIDVYLHFRAGEMSLLEYLWRAHGEHHLVWIRLLTWADVELFHIRGIPFMIAATVATVASPLLVWLELRQAHPVLGGATSLGLLAPMLMLSTANVTDCSVPINTTYPFTV